LAENGRSYSCAIAKAAKWQIRHDVQDFPNAKNPRLPYAFDLLWDLKYYSQLKGSVLTKKHHDCAKQHGIDLADPETVREYNRRCTAWSPRNQRILPTLQEAMPDAGWKIIRLGAVGNASGTCTIEVSPALMRFFVDAGKTKKQFTDLTEVIEYCRSLSL
jgi:hypothetical protein